LAHLSQTLEAEIALEEEEQALDEAAAGDIDEIDSEVELLSPIKKF
jgi:hypothetical protein